MRRLGLLALALHTLRCGGSSSGGASASGRGRPQGPRRPSHPARAACWRAGTTGGTMTSGTFSTSASSTTTGTTASATSTSGTSTSTTSSSGSTSTSTTSTSTGTTGTTGSPPPPDLLTAGAWSDNLNFDWYSLYLNDSSVSSMQGLPLIPRGDRML